MDAAAAEGCSPAITAEAMGASTADTAWECATAITGMAMATGTATATARPTDDQFDVARQPPRAQRGAVCFLRLNKAADPLAVRYNFRQMPHPVLINSSTFTLMSQN